VRVPRRNATRGGKTMSLRLESGDALVLGGPGKARLPRRRSILPATSTLLPNGGRINLTLRRVTKA